MRLFSTLAFTLVFFISMITLDAGQFKLPYERANRVKANLESVWIEVSIKEQRLCLRNNTSVLATYYISSGLQGVGQDANSFKTPLGFHQITQKIGEKAPLFTIFKSQKNTQRVWSEKDSNPIQDYVLSRILVLDGLEKGFNKGRDSTGVLVDSKARFIYIHGTAEESLIGTPVSHGCIRMKNEDVIELFDQVETGTTVWIHEGPLYNEKGFSPKP